MKYDDIIHLTRPRFHRQQMSIHDRAAQFGSFAALTGYEEAVEETARLTDGETFLDPTVIEEINQKLVYLKEHIKENIQVTVTYFVPDEKKAGGSYQTVQGAVHRVKDFEQLLCLKSGIEIPFYNIIKLERV